MFSLICLWINDWTNNREAGDFRHDRGYNDVTNVFFCIIWGIDSTLRCSSGAHQITNYDLPDIESICGISSLSYVIRSIVRSISLRYFSFWYNYDTQRHWIYVFWHMNYAWRQLRHSVLYVSARANVDGDCSICLVAVMASCCRYADILYILEAEFLQFISNIT